MSTTPPATNTKIAFVKKLLKYPLLLLLSLFKSEVETWQRKEPYVFPDKR